MADYVLLFSGGAMPETKEEQDAVMAAWNAWFGELGGSLKDGGNPFTPAGTNGNSGLGGDPVRQANSILAGLPANFFRANPDMLGGNPFTPAAKTIGSDGSVSDGGPSASGYSIVTADSLDDAVDKAKGCPVLKGGASITVYETFAVM